MSYPKIVQMSTHFLLKLMIRIIYCTISIIYWS